jgi:DNA-directed RNA polymerase III subunit RPC4
VKFLPNTQTKKPKKQDERNDNYSFGGAGYASNNSNISDGFEPLNNIDDKKFTKEDDYVEEDFFKDVKLPPTNLPFHRSNDKIVEENMIKEDELFFIQLPSSLPITSQKPVEKQQQQHGAEYDEIWTTDFKNTLIDLPKGYIGEMLVYKSGKRKLKLGNVLFDVVSGTESQMAESVCSISSDSKKFYVLGDVSKRILCVPDLEDCLK